MGTLNPSSVPVTIPVVGASFADGVALSAAGSTARVRVLPSETRTDYNVIAEKRGTNNDNVVMSGAHLDSVAAGPGINDNGSGSAALLETALQMAKVKPVNTVRYAWWGAEESGLLGSTAYVQGLSQAEKDRIALYLNYDMVGSPNYVFMTYDANESSFPAPGRGADPGWVRGDRGASSSASTPRWASPMTMPCSPVAATTRPSSRPAFPLADCSPARRSSRPRSRPAIWGGTAGAQFDPCYHSACDTLANVDLHALDVNSDLIAYAALTYAYSTESVNGVAGKPVPESVPLPEPAGPEGTFVP